LLNILVISEGDIRGQVPQKNFHALLELHRKSEISLYLHHFLYCYINPFFWIHLIRSDKLIFGIGPLHPLILPIWIFNKLGKETIIYTSWPYWTEEKWTYSTKLDAAIKIIYSSLIRASKTVVVNPEIKAEIQKIGGEAVYIPHCIDTSVFKPNKKIRGNDTVLFVGRLEERKGVKTLMEIAENLREDIGFRFAGDGELEQKIKESDSVSYVGYLSKDELVKEYNQASVLVLPSKPVKGWTELFGIVIIEAMACGTPVISTDCPGPKEIINEDVGRVVENDSPNRKENFKESILELMNNKDLRERMSKNARKYAKSNFDVEKISEYWFEVIKNDQTPS